MVGIEMHSILNLMLLLHAVTWQITAGKLFLSRKKEELFQETNLETTEFINFYGYSAENHTVYTVDGYILTMHRIPHGKQISGNATKQPVLLMHGVVASSANFVDSGKPSLGFFLADNGYDVWLGNMRGNFYSYHRKYNRVDKRFWDFSWEEMAEYDVSMMIDYVLNATGYKKLTYVAHSMGTTVGFALFSSQPEYQQKVLKFIALSPITSLVYAPTFLRWGIDFEDTIEFIVDIVRLFHILNLEAKLGAIFCPVFNPAICSLGFSLTGGYSVDLRNTSRDYLYLTHGLAGISLRTLKHYSQMVRTKGLYKYDYGQLNPPQYFLKDIFIPVVLFHSANDALADPLDVTILSRNLPNLLGIELVGPPTMNHLDMLFALDAKNIFQDKLLAYLDKM